MLNTREARGATAGPWGAGLIRRWLDDIVLDLVRQFQFSYFPPLMIYLAAGVSGLTAIVSAFFVKEHLGFSAALLAGLSFWAGIPWTLKIPLGHLVDLIWRGKAALVYLGAALIALSIGIMYALIAHPDQLTRVAALETWYVASVLLAPIGYVVQDVVADAMTVEAVPTFDEHGHRYSDEAVKAMHTTMQTLGRVAIVAGFSAVAGLNIWMFAGVAGLPDAAKVQVYADIHLIALSIPAISIAGVLLAAVTRWGKTAQLLSRGFSRKRVSEVMGLHQEVTKANWWIIGGGVAFVAFTLAMGLAPFSFNQEVVFVGSMAIVIFLMHRLLRELPAGDGSALIGTAITVFVFRAMPLPGPGVGWWEIDALGFDQQFLSVLSLLTSGLTLIGMLVLRPMMARRSIADVVIILTLASAALSLPNIGLFYGLHEWTARLTNGLVDARAIAILDTALESPLGQLAMIPMLAWIAKNAPEHLKATFFAVMASFTNLALSASSLGTKYLNAAFVVTREVRDRATGETLIHADYSHVGGLLMAAALISTLLPILTIAVIQSSSLRTRQ